MTTEAETAGRHAEKPRVQTAARTCYILVEVARAGPRGISAKELSTKLELPRQVVYHLTHTLVTIGMLRRAGASHYVLGVAAAPISSGFRRQLLSTEFFNDFVEEAAQATGESAYIGGWVDGEVMVLASQRGSATITAATLPPGTAGDAHARASGKLLLAMSAPEDVDAYIRKHEMSSKTPNTITTAEGLLEEIEKIKTDWVGYDNEEYSLGLSCMAVPIGEVPSELVLGISAPTDRFRERSTFYAETLREIANRKVTGS